MRSLEDIKRNGFKIIEQKREEFVKQSILSDEFLDLLDKNKKPFDLLMSYYRCAVMEIETKFRVLDQEYSLEYDGNKKIIDTASEMYEKVEMPFSLYGGYSRDAFDYITLNILILLVLCVSIAAPTFAEGYQNGSDCIL